MADDRQHRQAAETHVQSGASATHRLVHDAELTPGAHLMTPRRGYTHHGIYADDGKVVHYCGLSRSLRRAPVQETTLAEFAGGHEVWMRCTPGARYSAAQVVQRAYSRLGEDCYRLTSNNCEHFCTWCIYGASRSEQVERLFAWPRTALHAAAGALKQALSRTVGAGSRPGFAT